MDSSTVYIGLLPFDQTEEQVLEIARSIGPVAELRLVFDPMTGKSRGYGFVRYADHETAALAVRNLNNFALGTRTLKCLFLTEQAMHSDLDEVDLEGLSMGLATATALPILPPGMALFANQTPAQAVLAVVAALDRPQCLLLLVETKQMCRANPRLAEQFLAQCPQLCHALVEAALMLGVATPEVIQLCLNQPQVELDALLPDHEVLLQSVHRLQPHELAALDDDKRAIVTQIRQELDRGLYGNIIT
jgi:cleavage stimulation factor subunit 2